MIKAIPFLRQRIGKLTLGENPQEFSLQSIWNVQMAFRPNSLELGYTDNVIIAHSFGVGAAFCNSQSVSVDTTLIGQDCRNIRNCDHCITLAALDSTYAAYPVQHELEFTLTDKIPVKAFGRAAIVASEVSRIALIEKLQTPSVVTVGSVGTIIHELVMRKFSVSATDLDPVVIGANMSGVVVEDGNHSTLARVAEADIAVVTAMTLVTDTFDEILTTAKNSRTKIILFAQTGANFAPYLIEIGVHTVVAEHFPFYMFPGNSRITVHRDKR